MGRNFTEHSRTAEFTLRARQRDGEGRGSRGKVNYCVLSLVEEGRANLHHAGRLKGTQNKESQEAGQWQIFTNE